MRYLTLHPKAWARVSVEKISYWRWRCVSSRQITGIWTLQYLPSIWVLSILSSMTLHMSFQCTWLSWAYRMAILSIRSHHPYCMLPLLSPWISSLFLRKASSLIRWRRRWTWQSFVSNAFVWSMILPRLIWKTPWHYRDQVYHLLQHQHVTSAAKQWNMMSCCSVCKDDQA